MNVCIKVIPHKCQKYRTVGNWFVESGTLHIEVSKMDNWRFEMLVAVHELVEFLLCRHGKVKQKTVDKFDIMFERERDEGLHTIEEPGDDPDSPYRVQHCIATGVERIVAALIGVCWRKYEMKIQSL